MLTSNVINDINFEKKFVIKDIPRHWMNNFELYWSDLPGFPIVYVHVKKGKERLFGFPSAVSFYEQRLVFAGTIDQPQTIFLSLIHI